MSLLNYMLKAVKALNRAGVDYVLVGGLACILMGIRRVTEDVDFIIRPFTYLGI